MHEARGERATRLARSRRRLLDAMPRSNAADKAHMLLRKAVVAAVGLPRGASCKEVEANFRRAARSVHATLDAAEWAELLAATVPASITPERCREHFYRPVVAPPAPPPAAPESRHGTARQYDAWEAEHRQEINAAVQAIVDEQASLAIPAAKRALQRRVGWGLFKRLPEEERAALPPVAPRPAPSPAAADAILAKRDEVNEKRRMKYALDRPARCQLTPTKSSDDDGGLIETPKKLGPLRRLRNMKESLIDVTKNLVHGKDRALARAARRIFAKVAELSGDKRSLQGGARQPLLEARGAARRPPEGELQGVG